MLIVFHPIKSREVRLIFHHEIGLADFKQLHRMVIAKQNAQAFIALAIDLVSGRLNVHFSLILTYKTALIFHTQSIDE